jgi:hypothetical protein
MTSRKLTSTLLAIAATTLSFSALAQAPDTGKPEFRDGRGGGMFQRLDTDGDGLVSLQEFQAAGEARFASLDADGDGLISAEEFSAGRRGSGTAEAGKAYGPRAEHRAERMQQFRDQRFASLDADGDGHISRAEFDQQHMARFNALDANGNGLIDADERPARRDMRDGRGGRDGCARGEAKGYGKLDR